MPYKRKRGQLSLEEEKANLRYVKKTLGTDRARLAALRKKAGKR